MLPPKLANFMLQSSKKSPHGAQRTASRVQAVQLEVCSQHPLKTRKRLQFPVSKKDQINAESKWTQLAGHGVLFFLIGRGINLFISLVFGLILYSKLIVITTWLKKKLS